MKKSEINNVRRKVIRIKYKIFELSNFFKLNTIQGILNTAKSITGKICIGL